MAKRETKVQFFTLSLAWLASQDSHCTHTQTLTHTETDTYCPFCSAFFVFIVRIIKMIHNKNKRKIKDSCFVCYFKLLPIHIINVIGSFYFVVSLSDSWYLYIDMTLKRFILDVKLYQYIDILWEKISLFNVKASDWVVLNQFHYACY